MLSWTEIVVLAAPLLAFAVLRRTGQAFLVAYPIGVTVLWRTMIGNEVAAADSDLDAVFHIALYLLSALLALAYAAILLTARGIVALAGGLRSAIARHRRTAPRP